MNYNNIIATTNINHDKIKHIRCKYCNSDIICKCGKSSLGKQRYKCSKCGKTFIDSIDKRLKFDTNIKNLAIILYLNGMSIRGIQKTLNVQYKKQIHFESISNWIKNANRILKAELEKRKSEINLKTKKIEILKIDELSSYIKKDPKIFTKKNIIIKEYGILIGIAKE